MSDYHIKLLKAMVDSGSLMLDVETERVPYFDPFKPYGNKYHYDDVVEILGEFDEQTETYLLFGRNINLDEDWLEDDLKEKIDKLHSELPLELAKIIKNL